MTKTKVFYYPVSWKEGIWQRWPPFSSDVITSNFPNGDIHEEISVQGVASSNLSSSNGYWNHFQALSPS